MHGYAFLIEVLQQIATINATEQEKIEHQEKKDIQDFVTRWINTNEASFYYLDQPVTADFGIKEFFTEEDIRDHAEDFLLRAAAEIKHLRLMKKQLMEEQSMAQRHRTY